jgi:hypothetical protein
MLSTSNIPGVELVGAIVGGVLGFMLLVLAVVSVLWFLRKRPVGQHVDRNESVPNAMHPGSPEHIYDDVDAVLRPRAANVYDDVHSALQ